MKANTMLEGGVSDIFPPDGLSTVQLRKPIQAMADGKHVAIIADDDHGPDGGLVSIFRSMLALTGLGRTRPPPTLIISDPPFDEGDEIRVRAEQTHLEKVFAGCDAVEVL